MAAQIAIGKDIPNLKITLGSNRLGSDAESSEEGEITSDNEKIQDEENRSDVQIHRTLANLEPFRVYENKGGAFVTGLDMSSEVLTKKLVDRAERFGLQETPKTITQEDIDELYRSLNLDLEDGNVPDERNIRLDAIHMRGVDNMSTKDIINYFKKFGPSFVEWINDTSCNVVWLDKVSAARALLSLSEVVVVQKKDKTPQKANREVQSEDKDEELLEDDIQIIFLSDDEFDDESVAETKTLSVQDKESPEVTMDVETSPATESFKAQENIESVRKIDVPVPPGHWRLGIPHGKSKTILLRFASKDDKKLPGAEKRSQYYLKYGNPNYGGMRGLITNTRKRRMQAAKQKGEFEQQQTAKNMDEDPKNIGERKKVIAVRRPKVLRLRMHADDEEEKIRKRAERSLTSFDRSSVYDRLGGFDERTEFATRYVSRTNDYSDEEGHREEDLEEDEFFNSVKSTVSRPGDSLGKSERNNIWTSIAKEMSQDRDTSLPKRRLEIRTIRNRTGAQSEPLESRSHEERSFTGDLRSKLEKLKAEKQKKHKSPLNVDTPSEESSSEESD